MTCMPLGKQCLTEYHMAFKSDWSGSEGENDIIEHNGVEEEIEYWDGNLQKQHELK